MPPGLDFVRGKALQIGAVESIVKDVREEYVEEFLGKALKANALYENKYPLLSAMSRPIIVKHLVEEAHRTGARYVAHGCTGKGNDQVRFELTAAALSPELEVIAPWRDARFRDRFPGRAEMIALAFRTGGSAHRRIAAPEHCDHPRQRPGPGPVLFRYGFRGRPAPR